MKAGAVLYNGRFLLPGSKAHELYHDSKDKEHLNKLKLHVAQLEANEKELLKKAEKFEQDEIRKRNTQS